ncbi:hypothetical protein LEMLEM_LOCUS21321 [Lemmus lemmus]
MAAEGSSQGHLTCSEHACSSEPLCIFRSIGCVTQAPDACTPPSVTWGPSSIGITRKLAKSGKSWAMTDRSIPAVELAEISREEPGQVSIVPHPGEMEPGNGVHIMTEYCEPGIFIETYLELGNAMKEE